MATNTSDNALLGALVGALPVPVFVLDEDGQCVDVLGGAASAASRALVGQHLRAVLPQAVADELLASIRSALAAGTPRVEERQLPAEFTQGGERNGSHWFETRISPLPAEPGQPRRVAWLAMDIDDRKQLQHRLQESVLTDELTEVVNQRHFMRLLEQEIARQGRYKEPFCLLLMEVDHFETVQESFGQAAADACLREIARIIRQELRHSDVLGRVEECEFGVLLVNTPMTWALEVGERIRIRIARMPFALPKRTVYLSVSGGVTDFRGADTASSMLFRAEKAMFKSTEAGRDRVSVG